MSSSPRAAQQSGVGLENAVPLEVLPFPYGEVAGDANRAAEAFSEEAFPGKTSVADQAHGLAREAQARELGKQEGLTEARKNFAEQLERERETIAAALTQFTRERAAYYEKVEAEVVQLALSIARKILYREAQIDPLLLAGIVRVALEKIEGATGVTLRVHPQNAAGWKQFLSAHMAPAALPAIVEDAALAADRCIIETSMGATELGVEVQLKEIERGLMDLLAARPGPKL